MTETGPTSTPPAEESPRPTGPLPPPRPHAEVVILRDWPKIVMLWPTLLMSILCGILMARHEAPEPSAGFGFLHLMGLLFLGVLAVNLMTLLYDLNIWSFLLVVLLLVVTVLALFLLDRRWPNVWANVGRALSVRVYANSAFYFLFAIVLLLNLVIAWIITRFNYWKIEHNEIIIHRGFMHEQERHPTAQARFTMAVDDVIEYALLGAGKLVFTFGDDGSHRELYTVPFAHSKARKLDTLLGTMAVVSES
jgi:hypothetical protein